MTYETVIVYEATCPHCGNRHNVVERNGKKVFTPHWKRIPPVLRDRHGYTNTSPCPGSGVSPRGPIHQRETVVVVP